MLYIKKTTKYLKFNLAVTVLNNVLCGIIGRVVV